MRPPSRTSLFAAARLWDHAAVAAALAQAPELATASDPQGRTALHLACAVKPQSSAQLAEPNGLKTVTALLAAGADPCIADPAGHDAVDIARARRLPAALIERLALLKQRKQNSGP